MTSQIQITTTAGISRSYDKIEFKIPRPSHKFEINIKGQAEHVVVSENTTIDAEPKRFIDLMGDEQTFRVLLKWLKTFNKESPRVILIHGKSGLGKTTMINLIAKQAKYKIINVNHPNVNIAQMNHSFGKCCLLFDELDVQQDRKALVGMLIKQRKSLQVPVICICSDLYEPSMRILKSYTTCYQMLPPSKEQVATRLLTICEKHFIETDKITMIRLVEMCNNDLRTCVNALRLFTTGINSNNKITKVFLMDTLRSKPFVDFVDKDVNASLPNALEQIFYSAKGECSFADFESLAKQDNFELLKSGILKNYIQMPIMDRQLNRFYELQEWLELSAMLGMRINDVFKQSLFHYIHLLYGCPKRIRFDMKAAEKPIRAKPLVDTTKNVWELNNLLKMNYHYENKRILKAANILKANGVFYDEDAKLSR